MDVSEQITQRNKKASARARVLPPNIMDRASLDWMGHSICRATKDGVPLMVTLFFLHNSCAHLQKL
jgi:hypothetical protein